AFWRMRLRFNTFIKTGYFPPYIRQHPGPHGGACGLHAMGSPAPSERGFAGTLICRSMRRL
ncbi:MAG TPA: hypothetical protein VGP68_16595, partial [Gemmataceae bacterium]|nr:hypothetical protein [Gemmataceae bacterium]